MISDEKRKELLGEFYIDVAKEKRKSKFIEVINKFINNDGNKFLPFNSNLKNSNYPLASFLKAYKNLKLLDLKSLTFDYHPKIKDGEMYCTNDVFIAYDENDKKKKIYVRRGSYSSYYELGTNLGISTLRNIYEMFVYNVISYKHLFRRKKELYKLYTNLINENCLYRVGNGIYQFCKYEKSDKNNYEYNLFNDRMYIKCTYYHTDFSTYSEIKCFDKFKAIENFFKGVKDKDKITNKDDMEIILREYFGKEIDFLIKKEEEVLAKLKELTFFNS